MKIGPKYKIARRLGANVFDKTQSPKFGLSQARKGKEGPSRPKTDYGIQLLEKQKARFSYGLNERQFRTYVKKALAKKDKKAVEGLYESLESRLDNVVYRMGLANSRQFARQLVSHGHFMVNGVKITIPSYQVKAKDTVKIREGSVKKKPFENLTEKLKETNSPSWLSFDAEKKEGKVLAAPSLKPGETVFDLGAIIQFYQR